MYDSHSTKQADSLPLIFNIEFILPSTSRFFKLPLLLQLFHITINKAKYLLLSRHKVRCKYYSE